VTSGLLHHTAGSRWHDRPCGLHKGCGMCRARKASGGPRSDFRAARAVRSMPTVIYGARKVVWQLESSEPSSSAPVRIAVAFAVPLPGIR